MRFLKAVEKAPTHKTLEVLFMQVGAVRRRACGGVLSIRIWRGASQTQDVPRCSSAAGSGCVWSCSFVVCVDVAWNKNAAVFEQKYPLDTVSALDADDAVPDDEVVKGAEAAAVEGEGVDFPEVDADRKDEATLRDVVAEEVLVPAVGAPQRGGVVACGVVATMVDGCGELPGARSAGDGHACLPRALAVRVIHHDPAVSSDGGLLAQRARRRESVLRLS